MGVLTPCLVLLGLRILLEYRVLLLMCNRLSTMFSSRTLNCLLATWVE